MLGAAHGVGAEGLLLIDSRPTPAVSGWVLGSGAEDGVLLRSFRGWCRAGVAGIKRG